MAKNPRPKPAERLAKIQRALGEVQQALSAESPPAYLTEADLARRLRTTPRALRKIPALVALAVDLGGVLRWEPRAFERWLLEQQGRGAAA